MKLSVCIALVSVIFILPIAKGGGWFRPPEKTFTLAELSAAPGVKVKLETISRPDDYTDLPMVGFSPIRPGKRITILIFQNSSLFTPSFFKDYGPYVDPEHHSVFTSNLKMYLVVAGADNAVLSSAPVSFDGAISNGEAAEMHIEITVCIAADLMANSYLMLNEEFPRSGGQLIPVYFGSRPAGGK